MSWIYGVLCEIMSYMLIWYVMCMHEEIRMCIDDIVRNGYNEYVGVDAC